MTVPTLSIRYVTRMLELAQQRGAVPAELLAAAGLPPIAEDQPDVRVPTDAYYRLWGVTMSRLQDPTFPMRLAGYMDSASFDALGFAVTTSATFGDALVRIQRYLPFVTDGASWSVAVQGDTCILTLTQNGAPRPEQQYVDQFSAAHLVVVGRNLATGKWELDEVRFQWPEPSTVPALREFFRAPLRFDAEKTQLRFPRAALDLPFAKANPKMAAFFDRYIESILQRAYPEHDFVTSSLTRSVGTPCTRG